jgi:hypothetical protein
VAQPHAQDAPQLEQRTALRWQGTRNDTEEDLRSRRLTGAGAGAGPLASSTS